MNRNVFLLGGLGVIALLGATTTGRADPIPWTYNWSSSPSKINADAPGTGYLELTDEPWRSAYDNSNIVATNLRVYSTAPASSPETAYGLPSKSPPIPTWSTPATRRTCSM